MAKKNEKDTKHQLIERTCIACGGKWQQTARELKEHFKRCTRRR